MSIKSSSAAPAAASRHVAPLRQPADPPGRPEGQARGSDNAGGGAQQARRADGADGGEGGDPKHARGSSDATRAAQSLSRAVTDVARSILKGARGGPDGARNGSNEERVVHERTRDERAPSVKLDGKKKVVYSVPVEDLKQGELLRIRSQLGATNDVASAKLESGGERYGGYNRYPLDVRSRLVLGDSPDDTGGRELADSGRSTLEPGRHHGLYADEADVRVDSTLAGSDGYVNLVVDATVKGGSGPDETIELPGIDEDPGTPVLDVDEGHGGIDVVRLPAGNEGVNEQALESGPTRREYRIEGPGDGVGGDEEHPEQVVMSVPLGSIEPGDVIDAEATAIVNNLASAPTLARGELIISDSPTGTSNVGSGGSLAEAHGTNVQPDEDGYELTQRGAVTVKHHARRAYLNYVITSGYVGATMVPGGALEVREGTGNLKVRRYSASPRETISGHD